MQMVPTLRHLHTHSHQHGHLSFVYHCVRCARRRSVIISMETEDGKNSVMAHGYFLMLNNGYLARLITLHWLRSLWHPFIIQFRDVFITAKVRTVRLPKTMPANKRFHQQRRKMPNIS